MFYLIFLKGLIIGFAIAAPVGPIGVLCIQRSIHDGFKAGLATSMGATLADGVYGLIAGFGLTALSSFLVAHQFWIRLIGGLFLLYLGIKLLVTPYREKTTINKSDKSLLHTCSTTFFLTLTNPMTILSFIAVFSGLGVGTRYTHYTQATLLVLGILLGSAFWWTLLSGGIAFILHRRASPHFIRKINFTSGSIIFIFGIFALYTLYL